MAFEARVLDGWPHPGHEGQAPHEGSYRTWDDAPHVKEMSSPERGSRAKPGGRFTDFPVRLRHSQSMGGGQGHVRLTLRKPTLRGAGGIFLLLLPFIGALHRWR